MDWAQGPAHKAHGHDENDQWNAPDLLVELEGKIMPSQDSLRACEAETSRIVRRWDTQLRRDHPGLLAIVRNIGAMMCDLSDHTDIHGSVDGHPLTYTPL